MRYLVLNLFDNYYVDYNFIPSADYTTSELTYIVFIEDEIYGRKNIILKDEIPEDDREIIESIIKGELYD